MRLIWFVSEIDFKCHQLLICTRWIFFITRRSEVSFGEGDQENAGCGNDILRLHFRTGIVHHKLRKPECDHMLFCVCALTELHLHWPSTCSMQILYNCQVSVVDLHSDCILLSSTEGVHQSSVLHICL